MTRAEAAPAAGIFHGEEVPFEAVKDHLKEKGIETWLTKNIIIYRYFLKSRHTGFFHPEIQHAV